MGLRIGHIGLGARYCLFRCCAGRIPRRRHRYIELPKPDRGEFADETREIAKMMGRRGVRDAGFTGDRPQRQPGKPVTFQYPLRGLQQRSVQRAVMIGRVLA